ncbi:hypothetical protein Tco_0861538 [Tanacetum coccineum]|uniref:Uncharacterized protein n=1 Tax=Tanacetum coccineum TaxID=301880 RepID=A0ABQ5BI31_9ASTR
MFQNVDQLEKQLDKEEFQKIGSMAAFRVLKTLFQKFIKPRITLNDEDGIMAHKALYKREYDTRVNERQMQTIEGKDTSSRSANDAHADNADIRHIYDEEPMDELLDIRLRLNLHKSSKPWFASQVDVNNDLSKPVTTHYLPKERESACAKPHHMIVPSSSRWVPTGKIFTSSITTVDSEPLHGSNTDITNLHECIQTLDSSAGTSINVQDEQNLDLSVGTPFNLKKERIKACIK